MTMHLNLVHVGPKLFHLKLSMSPNVQPMHVTRWMKNVVSMKKTTRRQSLNPMKEDNADCDDLPTTEAIPAIKVNGEEKLF